MNNKPIEKLESQRITVGTFETATIKVLEEIAGKSNEIIDRLNAVSDQLEAIGHPELSTPFTSDGNKPEFVKMFPCNKRTGELSAGYQEIAQFIETYYVPKSESSAEIAKARIKGKIEETETIYRLFVKDKECIGRHIMEEQYRLKEEQKRFYDVAFKTF